MDAKEIAQWVIDNRYSKSENEKVSDLELYNSLVEKINANANQSKPDLKDIKDYGKFCVLCDRGGLKLLEFEEFIKLA